MRTDGLFTTHEFTINTSLDKPEYLVPVGDIHHDSPCHASHEFDSFLAYMKKERPTAYCLGMGDYLDRDRAYDRNLLEVAMRDVDSAKELLNDNARKEVLHLANRLDKMNWIGLLSGNHFINFEQRTKKGYVGTMHSDAMLAGILKTEYLGVCCGLTLNLVDKKAKKSAQVQIIAHHGKGNATTIGGGLNRVQRFLSGWEADIALMGDNHQRGILPTNDKISFKGHKLSSRTRFVGRTGSFLRGYVPNERNYVTDMALTPSSIGWIEFEFRLRLDEHGKPYVAIRGIQ